MSGEDVLNETHEGQRPVIAASVDSGLAGLLSMVLASAKPSGLAEQPPAEEALAEPRPSEHGPVQPGASGYGSAEEQEPDRPGSTALPVDQGLFETAELPPPPRDTAPIAPRSEPGGLRRLRQAIEVEPPKRTLNAKQLTALLDGLSRLTTRPGEEGLPPAMLLLDIKVRGSSVSGDGLYAVRSQIDSSVRAGDVALVVPELGVALFCGGLFFPGDLEVMGARVRRRALDRSPTVLTNDEVQVIVAGALCNDGEDPISFLNRAVWTFDESIVSNRQDILIDYGQQLLDRMN
jgi:hypothetical protein